MSQRDDNPIANIDFSKWTLGSTESQAETPKGGTVGTQIESKAEIQDVGQINLSNWSLTGPSDTSGAAAQLSSLGPSDELDLGAISGPAATPTLMVQDTNKAQPAASVEPSTQPEPSSPDEWTVMGEIAFSESDLDAAETCFTNAIRLNPICAIAHSNLGVVHHTRGDLAVAERCYLKAAAFDEHHADSFYGLAKLWVDSGDHGLALRYAARGIKRAPEHAELNGLASELTAVIDAQLTELHPE